LVVVNNNGGGAIGKEGEWSVIVDVVFGNALARISGWRRFCSFFLRISSLHVTDVFFPLFAYLSALHLPLSFYVSK